MDGNLADLGNAIPCGTRIRFILQIIEQRANKKSHDLLQLRTTPSKNNILASNSTYFEFTGSKPLLITAG
jgi:hypothetical protein